MTRTRFGLMATGDAHFVFDLEAGKTVTLRRWQRVQTFLRNNRRMKPLFLPVEPPAAPVIHPGKGKRKAPAVSHADAVAHQAPTCASTAPGPSPAPALPAPPVAAILSVFAS